MCRFPVLITTYNRPSVAKRSILSLFASDLKNADIFIQDDGSNDEALINFLRNIKKSNCFLYFEKENYGPSGAKTLQFSRILPAYSSEFFICSDSDVLYSKDWLTRVISLYQQTGAPVVSGFNAHTHHTLREYENYYEKTSVGGANLLIDMEFYRKHGEVTESNFDWKLVEKVHESGKRMVACKPSAVQHFGVNGKHATPEQFDEAKDV